MKTPAKTLALDGQPSEPSDATETSARIGPNAITRLGEAARECLGRAAEQELFLRAGLSRYLSEPPSGMVGEEDVIALHRALRASHPPATVRAVSWQAGLLTGDYLLANRIPKAAQVALRLLPRRLASRVLLNAISRHAWTFAGSGTFNVISAFPLRLEIAHSPLCRGEKSENPLCDYYAATFTRIFERLVDRHWRIVETQCAAAGGNACVFEVEQKSG